MFGLDHLTKLQKAQSRSICAENPTGAKGGGAQAAVAQDEHCTPAASELGKGWKVRPCLKNFDAGRTFTVADIQGPGVIRHIWITVLEGVHRFIRMRVFYDGASEPSIDVPLGDFFANGVDGIALINSLPIAVNPKGAMNSYWPMPFAKSIRIEVTNDGNKAIPEFFYQIDYTLEDVAQDTPYFHAEWRRSMTTRENPDHVILDGVKGRGHFVGTYCVWNQLSNGWWGEGEVKFFIDGDAKDAPTICGTGTEDYFGGSWGFVMDHQRNMLPTTFSTAFLGYAQAVYQPSTVTGQRPPAHGLYRWHIADPVFFAKDLRVTVQALGWWPTGKYQPLTDDLATTAFWYQTPHQGVKALPHINERLPR